MARLRVITRKRSWPVRQLPIRPGGQPLADDSFETQAGQAIDNMLAVLEAAGGTPADPFRLRAECDQLFGRGACDMKGFLAAARARYCKDAIEPPDISPFPTMRKPVAAA
jgi:hypothetical protein